MKIPFLPPQFPAIAGMLFAIAFTTDSQVVYTYDSADNRICRTISPMKNQQKAAKKYLHPVELERNVEATVSISPNPTKGLVEVALTGADATLFTATLLNLEGVALEKKIGENRLDFDLAKYASGIYLIVVRQGEFERVCKIIKE